MQIILIVTLVTYIAMICKNKYRTSIALIGSGVLLTLGVILNNFDVKLAFQSFPSEIIILIVVLALFTDVFERLQIINWIGYKFIKITREKKVLIMIGLPFLMYLTSLFMNNLTVILLFTWMALFLVIEYRLPTVPILVSMVIGSNIGGAPLPWADTPAVVLTIYTDFTLVDFLNKLFLPCFVIAIGLSIYTFFWYKYFADKPRGLPFKEKPNIDWKYASRFIILFIFYITGVSIGPFFGISIAYISLFFGGVLLILDKKNPMDALNDLPIMDSIIFIAALFLIGGILQYSGILKSIAEYMMGVVGYSPYLITLGILFIAFIISTFLSAGPTAATLLPICKELELLVPCKLIYAALALGILAGSSMLPWSATGGPILLSQTNRFIKKGFLTQDEKYNISQIYCLKKYLLFSIPYSLIILIFSAIYLVIYVKCTV